MTRLLKVHYFTADLSSEELNTEDAAAIKAAAVFQVRESNPKRQGEPCRYKVVWVRGNKVRLRRESWKA